MSPLKTSKKSRRQGKLHVTKPKEPGHNGSKIFYKSLYMQKNSNLALDWLLKASQYDSELKSWIKKKGLIQSSSSSKRSSVSTITPNKKC